MKNNPAMPEQLRAELAARVIAILGADVDLRALARELDDPTGEIRSRGWLHAGAITPTTAFDIADATEPSRDYRTDVVLRTAGPDSPVYMRRWWLQRELVTETEGQYGLYVHRFENDDPVGFHDHPWASASLLLDGGPIYDETARGTSVIETGDLFLRPANYRHRIHLSHDLRPGAGAESRQPAITLMATGRRVKPWGFEQPDGSITNVTRGAGDNRAGETSRGEET